VEDFASFYERARDPVFRAVLCVTGDRYHAEEAVAEAFARAYARWDRLRRHPNPNAWVARTALNAHRSWRRRRHRETLTTATPAAAGWDAPAESGALDARLAAVVRRLPLRQRQVLALRILLDLSTADAASMLGVAPKTVTVHLHRALATVRLAMAPAATEGGHQ
jgi:RNA polymerase sigma factor (sigma-70 family)